jgi:hypothetical protein
MNRKRHNPVTADFCESVQIICKLRIAKQLLNTGLTIAEVCRSLEVLATIDHRWQQLYDGMKATDAKLISEENRIKYSFYGLHLVLKGRIPPLKVI